MMVLRRYQLRERYRFNRHRLLHESVEELASGFRSSAIESERELIKLRVIQRRAYGLRDEEYLQLKILTCTLPAL